MITGLLAAAADIVQFSVAKLYAINNATYTQRRLSFSWLETGPGLTITPN